MNFIKKHFGPKQTTTPKSKPNDFRVIIFSADSLVAYIKKNFTNNPAEVTSITLAAHLKVFIINCEIQPKFKLGKKNLFSRIVLRTERTLGKA